ncbi:MAG: diguanylate cyclase/phosphodiesterase, partial [Pseudomonadota bacterium]|nr:diguanylate cyclase/phosphodiesterase [Pseudomonadota bacterium]
MFKNWSIKKQLQFWAGTTVLVVIIMALMANYAHSLIESSRQVLSEKLLPVEDSTRRLSSVVTAFSQRQQQILDSENLPQLNQFNQREALEQQFLQNWLRLAPVFDDESELKKLFTSLFDFYQDFLVLDSDLYQRKQDVLTSTRQVRQQSEDIDIQSAQLQQQLSLLATELGQRQLASRQAVAQRLKLSVSQLSALNYQSFLAASDQDLEQLTARLPTLEKELEQQFSLLSEALLSRPE